MYLLNGNNCRRIVSLYIMIIYIFYYNNVATVQCNLCVWHCSRSLFEETTPVRTGVARMFGRSPSSVAPVCECARVHSLSPTYVPEVREREKNWCSDVQSDADNVFSC